MKAAIFNPYLDTLGGGERYTMVFAKVLYEAGYKVDVQWNLSSIRKRLEARFGIDLGDINFKKDIKRGDGYDICFWLSDGSVPLLKSRKNFLHFQFPFSEVNGRSLLNRMKLARINRVICNSKFTKSFIDEEFGVDSVVIYPPVDVSKITPKKKENIILSVGRFSQLTQAKRQDILINSFKKLYDKGTKDWKLVLAGGTEIGADKFLRKLKKMSIGYPVEIVESPDFKNLLSLYGRAKIFWSASGFGIDEKREPLKVEHFGITVVEAMAAGAVPLVYNAGGHKEIVADMINGYLWNTKGLLIKRTLGLINDRRLIRKLAKKSLEDSEKYDHGNFKREILKLLEK